MHNPNAFTLPERFWAKVAEYPSGCLVWQAALNSNGYGVYNIYGRAQLAHRLAYVEAKGEIPDGLQIDHLCRLRACVNPEHLEAVTAAENNRRRVKASVNVPYITHRTPSRSGDFVESTHVGYPFMRRRCPECRRGDRARTRGAA